MNVGDLIIDPETRDIGILIEINFRIRRYNYMNKIEPYRVLNANGKAFWFGADYIEKHCEVISGGR